MPRGRARSWAACLLLVFCAGTFCFPHQHLNPIADLISDGPSDSGAVVWVRAPLAPGGGPLWSGAEIVDDAPCLACFWHDMTATVAAVFAMSAASVMLAIAVV